jgi:hemerythrin-like metal-binding protein
VDPTIWTIQWNESLSVGIPEIDTDHQRFILLVNDLNWAISARQEKPEIERRLRLIITDAKTHFRHEELLFAEHGFPGAAHHAELHTELTSEFLRVLGEFNRSQDSYHWIKSGLLIKKLLVDHLLEEDMTYREFLGSRMNPPGLWQTQF